MWFRIGIYLLLAKIDCNGQVQQQDFTDKGSDLIHFSRHLKNEQSYVKHYEQHYGVRWLNQQQVQKVT